MTDLANDKPDRLTVSCHKCGKVSAAIALVEQRGRLALEVSGFIGLCHFMEIARKAVDRELFKTIRMLVRMNLVELHRLDPDAFGFICRKCGWAYCIDCWENVHETFDEGFHDDTRGQCPEGHEQMLLDSIRPIIDRRCRGDFLGAVLGAGDGTANALLRDVAFWLEAAESSVRLNVG